MQNADPKQIPPTAVVRVSRANFDPRRFSEVTRMNEETGVYLVPAIKALPGLIHYFSAVSPTGSMVHVSIWDTEEHAQQLSKLKVMIVDARQAAEAIGVSFTPIVNYPIAWSF